jgi:pimeloyl-ACP methyl ester carboxylesterase
VDGSDLYGLILGTGRTGVVISHMRNDDVCQPAPFATELADAGYRVLLFDFAGFGVSPISTVPRHKQVVAAVAALRSDGVANVALIGGSMGATATLAAAPTITPAVRAVVALSPPTVFGDDDALAAVPKLKTPTLYAAGESETEYPANVRRLGDLTPKSTKHSVRIVAGSSLHGLWLTDPDRGDAALRTEIVAFLKANAPTGS